MQDVFEKVRALIAEKKGIDANEVNITDSFEDLNMDSLDSVELISELEDHFKVSIPNQELLQIKTVKEAVDSLSKLVGSTSN
jgi:acyl carrier protein